MPFGVELPDNLGEAQSSDAAPSTETAPETTGEKNLEGALSPEATKAQELLDLDKHDRFRFNGKEWTRKELANSHLMHADYTRKTQEISEKSRYVDNFSSDLQTVMREPGRLAEFERIYPKEYVSLAKQILDARGIQSSGAPSQNNSGNQNTGSLPPEMQEILSWKKQVEHERREQAVQSTQRELDTLFKEYGGKYKFANSDAVNSQAIAVVENGHKLTPQIIEKLFQQNHEAMTKLFESHYKGKVDDQKRAGQRAKDSGPGGSTLGTAPKKETFREAKDRWLRELESR